MVETRQRLGSPLGTIPLGFRTLLRCSRGPDGKVKGGTGTHTVRQSGSGSGV